jgi:hypothetical protein
VCCRLLLLLQWIYGGYYLSRCPHFQHFLVDGRESANWVSVHILESLERGAVFSYISSALQFHSGNIYTHSFPWKWIEKKFDSPATASRRTAWQYRLFSLYTQRERMCHPPGSLKFQQSHVWWSSLSSPSRFICGVGGGGSVNANNGVCVDNRLGHDRFEWSWAYIVLGNLFSCCCCIIIAISREDVTTQLCIIVYARVY